MSDRYFARIGLPAPAVPDLAALRDVVAAHTRTIPFENLDPLTGRDVDISPAAVTAKLVDGGRGGYCFEQNTLLRSVLDGLGYRVTGLAARVVWGVPPGAAPTALSHMLLRVELPEGPHLVDVGFGGQTLTGVLALVPDVTQETPHEPFRVHLDPASDGVHEMQARIGDGWRPMYRFDLRPAPEIDYEVGNWYVSRHPRSGFVTGLRAGRAAPDRRFALGGMLGGGGAALSVHHLGGPSERRDLRSAAELRKVLERDLLIDTSGLPDLDEHLARFF
ncbi:arylamine N-acetyltransferase family protein [Pseudonocardia broussonetiae]|uniref:Arylamine N-acetyltransferase n=1 Tax=Pseudonocardia broussonetiae TaxID=2736640 RepID=A0A6M6JKK4_9PSEU|nr:arylamine N-acetyltransferase [Pseudonocardia broussonetiae]QJY48538.1 arylamine N-acetyltransferase [Pseudonocardia broussonetiae]